MPNLGLRCGLRHLSGVPRREVLHSLGVSLAGYLFSISGYTLSPGVPTFLS